MKIFIEAIEDTESESGDFIQEEVTEIEQQAKDKIKAKEKSGKKYKYRRHICNHEEGKSCTVEAISDKAI